MSMIISEIRPILYTFSVYELRFDGNTVILVKHYSSSVIVENATS